MDISTFTLNDWVTIGAIVISVIGLTISFISLCLSFKKYNYTKKRSETDVEIEIIRSMPIRDEKKNLIRLDVDLHLKNKGGIPTKIERIIFVINDKILKGRPYVSELNSSNRGSEYITKRIPFKLPADETLSLSMRIGLSVGKDEYIKELKKYEIIITHTHGKISKSHALF